MKELTRYTLAYLLWAVSIVIAGAIGLIAQSTISNLLAFIAAPSAGKSQSADFYIGLQIRAADTWSYVILGFIIVALIVFFEHYYRMGAANHQLLMRFLLVTGWEMAVLTLSHLINFIIGVSIGATGWLNVYLPVTEILVTWIFFWLHGRLKRANVQLD